MGGGVGGGGGGGGGGGRVGGVGVGGGVLGGYPPIAEILPRSLSGNPTSASLINDHNALVAQCFG